MSGSADLAAARRHRERVYHEDQCAGVPLDNRLGAQGLRWFRCRRCNFVFNEHTEGAANMVRKSGVAA